MPTARLADRDVGWKDKIRCDLAHSEVVDDRDVAQLCSRLKRVLVWHAKDHLLLRGHCQLAESPNKSTDGWIWIIIPCTRQDKQDVWVLRTRRSVTQRMDTDDVRTCTHLQNNRLWMWMVLFAWGVHRLQETFRVAPDSPDARLLWLWSQNAHNNGLDLVRWVRRCCGVLARTLDVLCSVDRGAVA